MQIMMITLPLACASANKSRLPSDYKGVLDLCGEPNNMPSSDFHVTRTQRTYTDHICLFQDELTGEKQSSPTMKVNCLGIPVGALLACQSGCFACLVANQPTVREPPCHLPIASRIRRQRVRRSEVGILQGTDTILNLRSPKGHGYGHVST